jgi:hypothetical protein
MAGSVQHFYGFSEWRNVEIFSFWIELFNQNEGM